jgi:hypothetical protein
MQSINRKGRKGRKGKPVLPLIFADQRAINLFRNECIEPMA